MKAAVHEDKKDFALFKLGFRPFFLFAGLFSILLMLTFILGLVTGVWHYNYFPLFIWHAHEMIFGYAVAVIAGFLLTSVRNWTGMDTATGKTLILLLLLWLAGRIASAIPNLPEWLIAAVDIAFLPTLAVVLLRPILKVKQHRNIPVPLLLLFMTVGNALIYAEMLDLSFGSIEKGIIVGVGALLLLTSIIGGRVMPFFTERGLPGAHAVKRKWVELTATPSIALWLIAELVVPGSYWVVLAASAAVVIHVTRLVGWGNMQIWKEPMLWIIYLAYGWMVAGFLLQILASLELVATTAALHGWTVGTVGMFTLGMMARVSLGHTGRPISAHPAMTMGFVVLGLVSLSRVVVPIFLPPMEEMALMIAGAGWVLVFSIFVWIYAPYLIQPRADGQDG